MNQFNKKVVLLMGQITEANISKHTTFQSSPAYVKKESTIGIVCHSYFLSEIHFSPGLATILSSPAL